MKKTQERRQIKLWLREKKWGIEKGERWTKINIGGNGFIFCFATPFPGVSEDNLRSCVPSREAFRFATSWSERKYGKVHYLFFQNQNLNAIFSTFYCRVPLYPTKYVTLKNLCLALFIWIIYSVSLPFRELLAKRKISTFSKKILLNWPFFFKKFFLFLFLMWAIFKSLLNLLQNRSCCLCSFFFWPWGS